MAVEHTPLSTYILRELRDVVVPESVSWVPQTVGWKILAVFLFLAALYAGYRLALHWWHNRYRKEALEALQSLNAESENSSNRAFKILKVVLRYLDSRNANLFGEQYLQQLERQVPEKSQSKIVFDDDIAHLWMKSLIEPNSQLNAEQRHQIIERSIVWVKVHASKEPLQSGETHV